MFKPTWLILLSILFLSACSEIKIETPENDSVHPDIPTEFLISFNPDNPPDLTILLNGQDVSDLFTYSADSASASRDVLAAYTRAGTNIIEVTEPAGVLPNRFIIDVVGPVVQILHVDPTTGLVVQGYMEDAAGTVALTINGQNVTLTEGAFNAAISEEVINSELAYVTFVAEDAFGLTSQTVFARPRGSNASAMLPNTLQAMITDNGIQFMIDRVAEPFLAGDDLTGGLTNTTIASTNGSVGKASVVLNSISYGTPAIVADPLSSNNSARVATNVRMSFFRVNVTAKASTHKIDMPWPIPDIPSVSISASGTGTANNPNYNVTANMGLGSNGFNVNASGSSLSVSSYSVDFSGVTSIFEPIFDLVEPLVRGFISDLISDQLEEALPGIVEPLWADLPTGTSVPIMGKNFRLDTDPTSLATPAGNSLRINLGTDIEPLNPESVPTALGSIHAPVGLPTLAKTTPGGANFHAAATVNVGALNQALLAAYHSGLIHLELPIDASELAVIDGIDSVIGPDDEVKLMLNPISPPYVSFNDPNGALAIVGMERFDAQLASRKPGETSFTSLFATELSLAAPIDLGILGNSVDVAVDGIPEISIYDIELLNNTLLAASLVEAIVDFAIPKAVPALITSITTVPIPSFSGYSITLVDRWTISPEKNHVVLAGNLIVPAAAPAMALASSAPLPQANVSFGESERTYSGFVDSLSVSIHHPIVNGQSRYQVDGGDWSVWRYREQFNLYHLTNGEHSLVLCERDLGSMTEECSATDFIVE